MFKCTKKSMQYSEIKPVFSIPISIQKSWASLVAQMVKNLPAVQETRVWSLGWEDPLEEEMASYSSILAWRITWAEEPGGLQSMGPQRVRHDWATEHTQTIVLVYEILRVWAWVGAVGSQSVDTTVSGYSGPLVRQTQNAQTDGEQMISFLLIQDKLEDGVDCHTKKFCWHSSNPSLPPKL